jgi:hypothetical protein
MTQTGFEPFYLEVQLGDHVIWWNIDDLEDDHTTHNATYPWNSGTVSYLESVSLTANKLGSFPYQDDLTGATGTLVINPAPSPLPVLTNAFRLPNGAFQFTVTNLTSGKTNVLQASTNLVNWTNLYTNVSSTGGFTYTDNGAVNLRSRFYRARVLP